MKKINFPDNVSLECLFCSSSEFKIDSEHPPTSGDLVTCGRCKYENDFDSMLAVCKENVVESVKSELNDYIKSLFKK